MAVQSKLGFARNVLALLAALLCVAASAETLPDAPSPKHFDRTDYLIQKVSPPNSVEQKGEPQ